MTGICKNNYVTFSIELTYTCIFFRWDVSQDHEQRSLETIMACLMKKKDRFGCQNSPLINIDPAKTILDELNLMLHVIDVLIHNLVWAMIDLDLRNRHTEPIDNLEGLLDAIRRCGITFRV